MSDTHANEQQNPEEVQQAEGFKYFSPDMTIGEAMAVHPRVREVFAAFHLGGCAHCAINQYETLEQVCMGYGVDLDMLLEVLESVVSRSEATEA
jgi:hybrid cluster-associated redox disulfide protein